MKTVILQDREGNTIGTKKLGFNPPDIIFFMGKPYILVDFDIGYLDKLHYVEATVGYVGENK